MQSFCYLRVLWALVLGIAGPGTVRGLSTDTIYLPIVMVIPGSTVGEFFSCGDADRDGHGELYLSMEDSLLGYHLALFEHAEGNRYEKHVLLRDCRVTLLYDVGDADGDGCQELLFCRRQEPEPTPWLTRIESPDSFSLPRDTLTLMRDGGYGLRPLITDLDQDGKREISAVDYGYGVDLHEATGNDRFEFVARLDAETGMECHSYGDSDRDGRPEILFGLCMVPAVPIYEAVGDNQFEVAAVCTTLWHGEYFTAVADDMDRDGRREVIAVGGDCHWTTMDMFEAVGDNRYEWVWGDSIRGEISHSRFVCAGDIEGDGQEEFAVACGNSVRLFKCVGNDRYECVWEVRTPPNKLVQMYDLNGNGRDELIHRFHVNDSERVVIREYDGVGLADLGWPGPTGVLPTSVCRRGALLSLGGFGETEELLVLDISGRVVAAVSSGVWETRGASPGVYIVLPKNRACTERRRLLLVD